MGKYTVFLVLLIAIGVTTVDAKYDSYDDNQYSTINQQDISASGPPPHQETARMARYIVHNSDWAAVSSISLLPGSKGYPFNNIESVSDGVDGNSSGIPYMYVTPQDMTVQDLMKDQRSTLVMTLAQSDYCKQQTYDPEDPRCARIMLSGKVKSVKDPDELEFAQKSLFSRHPIMKTWPKDHGFFVAKLEIEQILMFDYFGGPSKIDVETYLHTSPTMEAYPTVKIV